MKIPYRLNYISHCLLLLTSIPSLSIASSIAISQDPLLKSTSVPGNVALALSVEFPTALVNAYKDKDAKNNNTRIPFDPTAEYLGYFDPMKCYLYHKVSEDDTQSYFEPIAFKKDNKLSETCPTASPWDGNFLNWAVTSTIDPFRSIMTGGNRSVDTEEKTYLLRSYDNGKSWDSSPTHNNRLFKDKLDIPSSEFDNRTSFTGNKEIDLVIFRKGNHAEFTVTPQSGSSTKHLIHLQVQVCKEEALLEKNCTKYRKTNGEPLWKPEGLIQKYALDLRFSAFGYLNDDSDQRDAGVMRAPMRFVGPTDPFQKGGNNTSKEWDNVTGIIEDNPLPGSTASTTSKYGLAADAIKNSGLINYINKFGQDTKEYKYRDPVSELYYAATRYFRNVGNVSAWSNISTNIQRITRDNVKNQIESLVELNPEMIKIKTKAQELYRSQTWDELTADQKKYWLNQATPTQSEIDKKAQELSGLTNREWRSLSSSEKKDWQEQAENLLNQSKPTKAYTLYKSSWDNLTQEDKNILIEKAENLLPTEASSVASYREAEYDKITEVIEDNDSEEVIKDKNNRYHNRHDPAIVKTLDAFPVIDQWDDPIAFSCQRNSILGIGDIFSNDDSELPGNTGSSRKSSIPADAAIDVIDLMKKIRTEEKLPETYSFPSPNSWIAGLAYHAKKNDLRADKPEVQNITTYWVDVVEDGTLRYNNQYYLAAKYGGPDDWSSGEKLDLYESSGTNKANGNKQEVERPKNYFLAGDPASMKAGLENAFEKMSWDAKNLSTTAFSFTNNDLTLDKRYYSVSYDSQYWSANIKAHEVDDAGNVVLENKKPKILWQTAEKLAKTIETDYAERTLLTWKWETKATDDTKIFFRHDKLSEAQQNALDTPYVPENDSLEFSNWLLGDSSSTKYRSRLGAPDADGKRYFNPLGDIINSKIIASGPPSNTLPEIHHPGYKKFQELYKDRETILFVGANDGMLHAIRTAGDKGGEELFAYMPTSFFLPEGPSDKKVGVITQLGQPYYNHRNYVDATVAVGDVDFKRSGNPNHEDEDVENHEWRSILVGGLGSGGYQYYAIDVTDPTSFLTQATDPEFFSKNPEKTTNPPDNLLWEFPKRDRLPKKFGGNCDDTNQDYAVGSIDPEDADHAKCIDMGLTFGTPNIIKTKKYGWVVAIATGYNNSSGRGKLYLLNPKNGQLLETHSTSTTTTSNGLAHTTAFMPVYANRLADSIYAGDINGQVWRFDLTGETQKSNGVYPAHLLAKLTSSGTDRSPQPVTTRPIVQVHPKDRKRYVLIGTGRLLNEDDLKESSQEQSFYALIDGTAGRFSTRSSPITRDQLGQGGPVAALADAAGVAANKAQQEAENAAEKARNEADPVAKAAAEKLASDAQAKAEAAEAAKAAADLAVTTAGATANGWVMDLGIGTAQNTNLGWRNIFNATVSGGNISFSSVLPIANYCQGTGSSRVYAMDFQQGTSILKGTNATMRPYIEHSFVNFDTQFVRFNSSTQLWTGGGDSQIVVDKDLTLTKEPRGQLSWREIPVAQ